jgi:prepilin-type N-terminal cleavage/methylation domain-containing protein
MKRLRRGFTLIEVALVLAVLAIVLAVAVPSYADHLARQRLRHAAGLLELDLRRARTLAVDERRDVYVSFTSGRDWCWGLSRQAPCSCDTGAPRCELGGMNAREHKGTLLQAGQGVTFEGGMGRAVGWTRIGLSNDRNQQLRIDLNPLGRPQVCGTDAPKAGGC